MREADEASTKELSNTVQGVVLAPPGIVILAPPEVPRNAERAQSTGRTRQVERRGQGHYKGRSPVGPRTVTQIVDALLLACLHCRACRVHHFAHDFPPLP
jgi:hypothetical protein